jgi:phosphatidylinositol glycan class B
MKDLMVLGREIITCGSAALAMSIVCDRWYFGFWAFPPYQWLHFNVSQGLAIFYGEMAWHYYLTQAVPLLTTAFVPFVYVGLYKATVSSSRGTVLQGNILKTLAFSALTAIGVLSLVSHKEFRFIYPILPTLLILASPYVASYFTSPESSSSASATPFLRNKRVLAGLVALNVVIGGYLSLFHQPAALRVLSFLRSEYERIYPDRLDIHAPPADDPLFALFLTPCHSTPWRSHLVYPRLRARALTCEPPLHTEPGSQERAAYRDENNRFYDDGIGFLGTEMWPATGGENIPRYIVGFEGVEETVRDFFAKEKKEGRHQDVQIVKAWEGFNGLFNEDWRRTGKLVVWDTGVNGDS